MQTLHSLRHPLIRQWQKWLKNPSLQRHDEVLLIEGEHGVIAGLTRGFECLSIFIGESTPQPSIIAQLPESIRYQCPKNLMARLSSLRHVDHPLLAVFRYPQTQDTPSLTDDVVILDRLQDPGNIGTILRTCALFGIRWIYALQGTASLWQAKTLRAAQGAHFHLHLKESILPQSLADLQQSIFAHRLFSLAQADGQSAPTLDLRSGKIWVLGQEGAGIGDYFQDLPHEAIAVPTFHNAGIDSLNVGVSASLLLYEQYRQRHF